MITASDTIFALQIGMLLVAPQSLHLTLRAIQPHWIRGMKVPRNRLEIL